MKRTPPCDCCGKTFPILPWEDTPAMLGFVTDDKTVNVCRRCIMRVGAMPDEEKAIFFKNLERN